MCGVRENGSAQREGPKSPENKKQSNQWSIQRTHSVQSIQAEYILDYSEYSECSGGVFRGDPPSGSAGGSTPCTRV